jgi:protein involved in polysaccharide export with SLBB domain
MKKSFLAILFICLISIKAQDRQTLLDNMTSGMNIPTISVTIGGDFIVTGSFSALGIQRLDHFLTTIFNEAKAEMLAAAADAEYSAAILKELNKYRFDNILMKRVDGTELTINLEEFRQNGDFSQNPYLLNDDVIIFPNADVSKNVLISVTVSGDFFVTGSFRASSIERVDEFMTRLHAETKQAALTSVGDEYVISKIDREFSEFALRGIKLISKDGTERNVDLERFRMNGDVSFNPYLTEGDILLIPSLDIERNFIEISGAVNNPRKFQFIQGDKLSDAINFALGINPAYENVKQAEISRLSYDGNEEEIITLNIGDDFILQRGDRIRILADETQRRNFYVNVIGEVNKPGSIYITKNNTTLYDVIQKAGGFTDKAWLAKSKIIRGVESLLYDKTELVSEYQMRQLERELEHNLFSMSRLSNLMFEDTAYFALENELRQYNEFGITDFTGLKDSTSETSNRIVKHEDIIVIPEFENVVYVFGQVPKTGKYDFIEGVDYEYYIDRAGGFGQEADEDVILIKGLSHNWIDADDIDGEHVMLEPGDFLWIRKEPVRDFYFYLGQTGAVAGIIGTIATVVLLINQFNK